MEEVSRRLSIRRMATPFSQRRSLFADTIDIVMEIHAETVRRIGVLEDFNKSKKDDQAITDLTANNLKKWREYLDSLMIREGKDGPFMNCITLETQSRGTDGNVIFVPDDASDHIVHGAELVSEGFTRRPNLPADFLAFHPIVYTEFFTKGTGPPV